jgi:acyl-[acyl-carrier-protein]-phospholipid O-acyltransferase/long-chain-fatty-acid--[acyl-carrier-protein] ligase
MKRLLRWLLRLCYRFRTENESVLAAPGPVLLIPNHTSWLDWLFVGVCLEGDWRFVVSRATAESTWLRRRVMLNRRTFPIDPDSPYAVKHMAEHLRGGGRLVLFAEGRLSCTGALMKLFDGTGFLLHKTGARVITCYLRGAYRLPRSPNPAPKKWFPTVTAHFSELLTPPRLTHVTSAQARAELTHWVRQRMIEQRFAVEMALGPANVLTAIVETARQQPRKIILEDATRKPLSYRRLLVGAALLARQWQRLLAAGEQRIGVLLPNVMAMPVTLLSLWALEKTPAVLNFSTGPATMLACARLAGLKQVITSRAFLERARLDVQPLLDAGIELIFLEEVRAAVTGPQKLAALLRLTLNPDSLTRRSRSLSPDRAAVVLFTSGSEAEPKAVELSHANLLANIRQLLSVTDIHDADRVFNCLPLFHSFGLTVGTLAPLVRGVYVFLYPTPLHYRTVPTMIYDTDCTVFLSTNTFLRGYARKAHPYDFRSVRLLFAGAEKLQETTAATWAQRFGVRILEGYGATECSPAVSLNTPLDARFGSVGRLLPGMDFRLEPLEGLPDGGRLLLRGPNVMRGYLNPDANATFKALGGWYDTGDIARVDADGFLYILDRARRFAKISGEMVSLTAIENALAGAFPQYGLRCQVAILSRPDETKGEALIAVTNEARLTLEQIRQVIRAKGFSNLCQPRQLRYLPHIPTLGTGKINHRQLAEMIATEAR